MLTVKDVRDVIEVGRSVGQNDADWADMSASAEPRHLSRVERDFGVVPCVLYTLRVRVEVEKRPGPDPATGAAYYIHKHIFGEVTGRVERLRAAIDREGRDKALKMVEALLDDLHQVDPR